MSIFFKELAILSLYLGGLLNLALYRHVYALTHSYAAVLQLLALVIIVTALCLLFLSILLPQRVYRGIVVTLLLLTAVMSYFMYHYRVLFDQQMLSNILLTHWQEARAYLHYYFYCWIFGLAICPSVGYWYATRVSQPFAAVHWWRQLSSKLIMLLVLLGMLVGCIYINLQQCVYLQRKYPYLKKMVVPWHGLYSIGKYLKLQYFTAALPYTVVGQDAHFKATTAGKPPLLVLVIGESARAQNYAYMGYPRNTNQYTQDLGLFNFKKITACGTSTAYALPCMFSDLPAEQFSVRAALARDNVLDILQRAGVSLLWLDNNGGCKEVCKRVHQVYFSEANDAVLLEELEKRRQQLLQAIEPTLVVLHLIGSHGPRYHERYPPAYAAFTPACTQADAQNCQQEEIINSYDNSILYTDFLLARLVKFLEQLSRQYQVSSAMLYLSDHGESLGEKGLYLHGAPLAIAPQEQLHIPMQAWFSQSFLQQQRFSMQCLHNLLEQARPQQALFASLLGLLSVETVAYQAAHDVFAACRF
jgi:lipid A ethanolaminephosphotransferase